MGGGTFYRKYSFCIIFLGKWISPVATATSTDFNEARGGGKGWGVGGLGKGKGNPCIRINSR